MSDGEQSDLFAAEDPAQPEPEPAPSGVDARRTAAQRVSADVVRASAETPARGDQELRKTATTASRRQGA